MNSVESKSLSQPSQQVTFLDEIAMGYVTVSENVLTLFLDETPLSENDKLAYLSYFLDNGFIKDVDTFNCLSTTRRTILDKIESERVLSIPERVNKIKKIIIDSIRGLI